MVVYQLIFMSQAQKDAKKLSSSGLKPKVLKLLEVIQKNPLQYPPEYEYLQGDMKGLISRRINKQHRLVYEIFEEEQLIRVYRMWGHYE
jgi:Txe/YoeB family toxin of toxin-antitoxin system